MTDLVEVMVKGDSMWPSFRDGDCVLFSPTIDGVEAGEVVLLRHPFKDLVMVKRIKHINLDGSVFVVGDNPDPLASEDSHNFGAVRMDALMGRFVESVRRA